MIFWTIFATIAALALPVSIYVNWLHSRRWKRMPDGWFCLDMMSDRMSTAALAALVKEDPGGGGYARRQAWLDLLDDRKIERALHPIRLDAARRQQRARMGHIGGNNGGAGHLSRLRRPTGDVADDPIEIAPRLVIGGGQPGVNSSRRLSSSVL